MCASVFAANYPFGTEILNGGRVEPISLNLVGSTNEHMNFCFAHQFSDKSIYLYHSQGIHTVTEYSVHRRSFDGGKTWERINFAFGGLNAFERLNGDKCNVHCWENAEKFEHPVTVKVLKKDESGYTEEKTTIKLPFESICHFHRDVIRTQDGRLLLNAYGRKKGESKFCSFIVESKDDGKTWQYLSMIMEDKEKKYTEGPNETTVIQLKNGDILAFVRTGTTPTFQFRSTDGGKTWGDRTELCNFGVAPTAKQLADGTLVVLTGRPGLFMYIDFSGTGKNYQKFTVWGNHGSSYASLFELEPNKIMIIYDESDFGSWRTDSKFSRVMAVTYNVVRDDSLKFEEKIDPRAKNYQVFYTPLCRQSPTFRNLFTCYAYHAKGEKDNLGTWWQVQEIAERPHPILHLENKGVNPPVKFAHYSANLSGQAKMDFNTCEVAWECRLTDMSVNGEQFRVLARLKKSGSFTYVAVTKDGIIVLDNNKAKKIPCKIGADFHSFVLKLDAASNSFVLYVDGKDTPICQGKLTATNVKDNYLQFGDGSAAVFGGVDLSYLGYSFK